MPVTGTSNLPVAPRSTPWNPRAATERIFEACGGNIACVSRGFLFRRRDIDAHDPKAYSLPFCDVIDGRLHIVPKGIAACAGRGQAAFDGNEAELGAVRARINAVYDRVRKVHEDWPVSPFSVLTADATGTPFEGVIAFEGTRTGDGRFIATDALVFDNLPVPLVFDPDEMDHSGATIGTINEVERRDGGIIWGRGNFSASSDPKTQALVTRATELLEEGAVGVSVSLDDVKEQPFSSDGNPLEFDSDAALGPDVEWRTVQGRIRSVAIVDEAAFIDGKMSLAASISLVAAIRPLVPTAFANPNFGNGSHSPKDNGGDERLVWQEPERPEEEGQFGCPFTINDDGTYFGHLALWGRCHVGYPGTCVRPPKEPAAYRGYLTGERVPGIPTGPLVMKTTHASLKVSAEHAQVHYDHTGYAAGDNVVGPDAYGIWAAGQLRGDVTEEDIEILRGSALSGDWRHIGGQIKLVGVLVVSAPGFRIARALAASGTLVTVGPGCEVCGEEVSIEERVADIEARLAGLGV